MPRCSNCGKSQARFKNNGSLCSPCLIEQNSDQIKERDNNDNIIKHSTSSNNESVSSDNSLIKIGVLFESLTVETNLQTPKVSVEDDDANATPIKDIPNVSLDINDEIPIIISNSGDQGSRSYVYETSDKAPQDSYERHEYTYTEVNDKIGDHLHGSDDYVADGINDLKCILKESINKLYETIDILKEELEEKNFVIRTLLMRDANYGSRSTPNTSINQENPDVNNSDPVIHIEDDIREKQSSTLEDVADDTIYKNVNETTMTSDDDKTEEDYSKPFSWEKHSSGFASKMLNKMGYKGKGLGKFENGITEPIMATNSNVFGVGNKQKEEIHLKKKLLYIASSSMLNQMDEKRLSRNNINVKVQCHGGCTIRCIYTHLPQMFKLKPDFILLHIGSNDCTSKTSDEVLKELKYLTDYIKKALPCSKLIISLPIIRADNSTASAIQRNLNVKLQRLYYPCLDNSNIDLFHLGKKGLHLNNHGTRKMAKNIISLIKRL